MAALISFLAVFIILTLLGTLLIVGAIPQWRVVTGPSPGFVRPQDCVLLGPNDWIAGARRTIALTDCDIPVNVLMVRLLRPETFYSRLVLNIVEPDRTNCEDLADSLNLIWSDLERFPILSEADRQPAPNVNSHTADDDSVLDGTPGVIIDSEVDTPHKFVFDTRHSFWFAESDLTESAITLAADLVWKLRMMIESATSLRVNGR
jgi:hypothetical protein